MTPADTTPLPPPFTDNPDPEPWQFCNELHSLTMEDFRFKLCDLRQTDRASYIALVAQVRTRNR